MIDRLAHSVASIIYLAVFLLAGMQIVDLLKPDYLGACESALEAVIGDQAMEDLYHE